MRITITTHAQEQLADLVERFCPEGCIPALRVIPLDNLRKGTVTPAVLGLCFVPLDDVCAMNDNLTPLVIDLLGTPLDVSRLIDWDGTELALDASLSAPDEKGKQYINVVPSDKYRKRGIAILPQGGGQALSLKEGRIRVIMPKTFGRVYVPTKDDEED